MKPKLAVLSILCVASWSGCSSDAHKKQASRAVTTDKADHDSGVAVSQGAGDAGSDAGHVTANNVAYPDLRGGCSINSGYPGDEACILPPAPGEGMQIHIGPSDYTNADEVAKYILHAGQEKDECWTFHTPNDQTVLYQQFVLSGRPGTHHVINTMYDIEMADGGFGVCADPGTGTNINITDNLPGASKPYNPRLAVAPENQHVGRKILANSPSQADMHYYNFGDVDIIREFWLNIYFVKPEQIQQQADQVRAMGGLSWTYQPIPPHSDMVYKYECPIHGDGRLLELLGHYHSHGQRFTASVRRVAGGTDKVFEMYDYTNPATFQYDTITTNPMFRDGQAGAVSGMLDVHDGDSLLWECHIVNDSDVALTYTNELKTGEMCNLWGASLGVKPLNCVLQ